MYTKFDNFRMIQNEEYKVPRKLYEVPVIDIYVAKRGIELRANAASFRHEIQDLFAGIIHSEFFCKNNSLRAGF